MATLEQLDAWGSLDGATLNAYTLEQLDALEPLLASGTASISITESAIATLREQTATLDQLDGFGTLEQLDAYGTLEQLNFLIINEMSASDNIAITESASATRVPTVSASDSMAITTTASTVYLLSISGTGDISATTTASVDRFRTVSAADNLVVTTTSGSTRIRIPNIIDANIAITQQVPLTKILATASASANISITALMVGEILGETWSDVSGRTVTWSVN